MDAKLFYKNDTIQHAGVVFGMGWPGGVTDHFGVGAPRNEPGPLGNLALLRSVSAITGACLAVLRDLSMSFAALMGKIWRLHLMTWTFAYA